MKKLSAIFVALLLVAVSAVSAFAAGINDNEQKVLDELKTSVKMQGTEMYLPEAYVNQAENFFNTIDMTEDQADKVLSAIKSGKTQLEATGAKNIADCTTAQKKELMTTLKNVMAPLNGTASYDKTTGEITLKSESGEVIFKAVPTLVEKGSSKGEDVNGKTTDGGVVKTTGASANTMTFVIIGVAAVLVIAGGAFFVIKKRG
ncbi:LPXTG cell wall anchor domain-containing protein [Lachnoclostridium sp. MSJ-17]|uniref:LPXTG cell wall anchor domain-containing protein n=1 Tax=Lachnoclostridium sp. MSJ-17 TaxID=2841516 RepID=UPI001C108481|nr:LPXTG cell wall anchor domain-containing protein [Lachnoclostridium sp. MSJ-17]MBU5461627.1 LPXTG cell wall anchor domain-containing protein [Lachnoclostridium sp. MSJ-17]